jgi:hypothetical protein
MKPRATIIEMESVNDIPVSVLREKAAYWLRINHAGNMKTLAVKEVRVNVVKPEKRAVK